MSGVGGGGGGRGSSVFNIIIAQPLTQSAKSHWVGSGKAGGASPSPFDHPTTNSPLPEETLQPVVEGQSQRNSYQPPLLSGLSNPLPDC